MERLKTLTPEAVALAANRLMELKGATTTLEVKKRLRQLGYMAMQQEVSLLMDLLCEEEGWGFDFNGLFRIYKKLTPLQLLLLSMPPLSMN